MSLCAIYYNDLFLNPNGELSDITKVLPFKEIDLGYNINIGKIFALKCYGNKYLAYKNNKIYLESDICCNCILYKPKSPNIIGFDKYIFWFHDNISVNFTNTIGSIYHTNLLTQKTNIQKLFIDGYVVLPEIDLSRDMEDDFQKACDIILSRNEKRIHNILTIDPCFQKLLCHKDLIKFLNQIFDEPFHLTTYSSNKINKNSPSEHGFFHVDYPYHNIQVPYPDETLGIQVLILLDDFNTENGSTNIIPGSQIFRHFPSPSDIQGQTGNITNITGKKGQIVVWLGKLWHCEGKSTCENYRSALLANFSPLKIPSKDPVCKDFTFTDNLFKIENEKLIYSV